MKACEEELAEETTKAAKDKEKEKKAAEDVRKSAMETFSESRKRCASRGEEGPKAKRPKRGRSGTETIRFLMEKREDSRAQHTEEMKLRGQELELKKKRG